MTHEQSVVVEARKSMGYSLLGKSTSLYTSGHVYVMTKGKHTMAINCLGYDEHTQGVTWNVHE
jgi:hypothetical protein